MSKLSLQGRTWLAESTRWLLDPARLQEAPDRYLLNLMAYLNGFGLDLAGGSIILQTMHPQLEMMIQRWRPRGVDEVEVGELRTLMGRGRVADDAGLVELYFLRHGHTDEAVYRQSPFYHAQQAGEASRWKLSEHRVNPRFPIFTDLLARGETDYLVTPLPLPKPYRAALSLSTRHADGFPEDMLVFIEHLLAPLRLSLAHKVERITLSEVLSAYLSRSPAQEVAQGNVRLGRLRSLDAIVGFADLRGFTMLSQTLPGEVLVNTMNQFFAAIEKVVRRGGGEVLKFMGDGAVFVFPCEPENETEVADRAVEAMAGLGSRLQEKQAAEGVTSLRFAAALHRGQVRYGNVGAPDRLDFTIIGADVSKTARLEEIAARHERELVLSAELARLVQRPVTSLGHHTLKGFKEPHEVFVPA